jgi:phosphate transport system substrate-binding protein
LIDGELDLLLTANRMGQAQRKLLPPPGEDGVPTENVLGLQAVALAVHPNNPVRSISETQLHALLHSLLHEGKGNWQQLGGADGPITLLTSDQLTATVLDAVLGGVQTSADRVDESALARKLKYNPAALALVPASEAEHFQTLAVTVAGVPLAPKPALIASEDYPLAQRLYLYTGAGTQNPHRGAFVDFALGNAGQVMVAQNGLINLNPRAVDAQPRGDLPADYRELIAQGERLSISFRFDGGGIELDARAQRDIGRLQRYLQQPEQREKKIALVGFSDNQRRESMARAISRFRAVKVQQALRQVNLAADRLLALGSSSPLTLDASTAEQRNSRVEVWLF